MRDLGYILSVAQPSLSFNTFMCTPNGNLVMTLKKKVAFYYELNYDPFHIAQTLAFSVI